MTTTPRSGCPLSASTTRPSTCIVRGAVAWRACTPASATSEYRQRRDWTEDRRHRCIERSIIEHLGLRLSRGATILRQVIQGPSMRQTCLLVIALTLVPARSEAVSITLTSPGFAWRATFGLPVASATPTSELFRIVDAAADYWSARLLDDRAITIQLGFGGSFSSSVLAATGIGTSPLAVVPMAFRAGPWFVDPAPDDHSEFDGAAIGFTDLGAGLVNTSVVHSGGTGDAAGIDLYTVALHEVGHALGFFDHLSFPAALMDCCYTSGTRTLPSDADILAVAAAGGYTNFVLNDFSSTAVPEPATLALVAGGLTALRRLRRRA